MKFAKYEGCANDFIVVSGIPESAINEAMVKRSIELCDRRRGIGADGIVFVLPSQNAHWKMRILNADGSEPEMCGNGIRCFARYLQHQKLDTRSTLTIETRAGIKTISYENNLIRVAMGAPILDGLKIPTQASRTPVLMESLTVSNRTFNVSAISMGNPHGVIYENDLSDSLVHTYGPLLEKHPFFPAKANIEFIQVINENEIVMRVWERGCGETMACGTGACASMVSGVLNNKNSTDVVVRLLGGDLRIEWDGKSTSEVFMTGPANLVYTGEVTL